MPTRPELILVVDDSDEIITFLIEMVLPHRKYRSVAAQTGARAQYLIKAQRPDLIMLDIELPDTTGLNLVEKLRRDGTDTPVIMMTAFGSEETAVSAFRLGVQDYLIKPFTRDEALAAIERILKHNRLQREYDQKVQELTVLEFIGHSVATGLDLDKLFTQIVEAGVLITQASAGCLLLYDEETDELYFKAEYQLGQARPKFARRKVGDDLIGQVLRTGRPIRRGRVGNIRVNVIADYDVRSALQVPLATQNKTIGVLSVHNSHRRPTFSQNDQQRLSALADYAVIAWQNASHHQALLKTQEELTVTETVAWMGMFGSIWAHSVAQETSSIRNYLAVLERHLPEGRPRELLAKVDDVAVTIQNIPITGKLPTETENVMPLLIDHTLKIEAESHIQARSKVNLIFELRCPQVGIRIDQSWLAVVIETLINNSLRAMPEGGTLKILSAVHGDQVQIDLIDSGQGISTHLLPYFLKQRVPKENGADGSGMGVLIARYILSRYGQPKLTGELT